jgi:hypothetical protein
MIVKDDPNADPRLRVHLRTAGVKHHHIAWLRRDAAQCFDCLPIDVPAPGGMISLPVVMDGITIGDAAAKAIRHPWPFYARVEELRSHGVWIASWPIALVDIENLAGLLWSGETEAVRR